MPPLNEWVQDAYSVPTDSVVGGGMGFAVRSTWERVSAVGRTRSGYQFSQFAINQSFCSSEGGGDMSFSKVLIGKVEKDGQPDVPEK